jgi:hypothetical protein
MQLLFWDDKAGNWSNVGVFRNDTAILASGDNCTFVGYTTHFTTFTVGGLALKINAVNPATVRDPLAPLSSATMPADAPCSAPVRLPRPSSFDGVQDASRVLSIAETHGGRLTIAFASCLFGLYLLGLAYTTWVRLAVRT